MTEKMAVALLFAGGLLTEAGSIIGLGALGSSGEAQAAAAVMCLVIMSFLVGVIGLHYERRRQGPSNR